MLRDVYTKGLPLVLGCFLLPWGSRGEDLFCAQRKYLPSSKQTPVWTCRTPSPSRSLWKQPHRNFRGWRRQGCGSGKSAEKGNGSYFSWVTSSFQLRVAPCPPPLPATEVSLKSSVVSATIRVWHLWRPQREGNEKGAWLPSNTLTFWGHKGN